MRISRPIILRALTIGLSCVGCGGGTQATPRAAQAEPAKAASTDLGAARVAVTKGEGVAFERQLEGLVQGGSKEAISVLAELYLGTGRPDQVLVLLPNVKPEREVAEHVLLRARARQQLGEVEVALSELGTLTQLSSVPWLLALEAKVLAGAWHLERGQKEEAEKALLEATDVYEGPAYRRAPAAERARSLAHIGRAAHLLGAYQDANHAYDEAEALAPATIELLLLRAELFLEKYDTGHAREVIEEAGALGPHHPGVLFARAALELETSMNFALAAKLCTEALATNPRLSSARALLAGVALRDLDFDTADRLLAAGLAERPRDLELLSMAAAVRFLAEDEPAFERHVEHVLAINPRYARVFWVVSEYAEWEHRYADMERLLRRASRIDPDDGAVRGRLGLTLVRAGSDSAGVVELRRAFDLDPYDVRVLNTLELFETILPARYVERKAGAFTYRLPKDEEAWLMRYVPALLEEAHASMRKHYDFEPRAGTLIEIYESREHFAVRTSGLPHIGIAGVCFGRKLATVSPRGAPANLGMTLWHELGHVFHIGLSKSRVPRFLTEGLAEWETAHLGRGWSRELDASLYEAIERDRLPAVGEMNRAFTRAERMEDVAVAYYASGRLAEFLVEHYGMQQVRDLLRSLGEKGLRPGVYREVLHSSPEDLDLAFRAWLAHDLERYDSQFIETPRRLSFEEAREAGTKPTAGRAARLELARAELETGRGKEAEKRLRKLVDEQLDAPAGYWLARLYFATERLDEAEELLTRLFKQGFNGADLRLVMAKIHQIRGDAEKARAELERALRLDPKRADLWALMASLEHESGTPAGELTAVRNWAGLSEHDGALHRRVLELLLAQPALAGGQPAPLPEDSEELVRRAIWADLSDAGTHRLAARVFERLRKYAQADYEWDSALACPDSDAGRTATREERALALQVRRQPARAPQMRQGTAP